MPLHQEGSNRAWGQEEDRRCISWLCLGERLNIHHSHVLVMATASHMKQYTSDNSQKWLCTLFVPWHEFCKGSWKRKRKNWHAQETWRIHSMAFTPFGICIKKPPLPPVALKFLFLALKQLAFQWPCSVWHISWLLNSCQRDAPRYWFLFCQDRTPGFSASLFHSRFNLSSNGLWLASAASAAREEAAVAVRLNGTAKGGQAAFTTDPAMTGQCKHVQYL